MVEELKIFQEGGPAAEEEITTGRKVAGFLLTLLLIPFLFAGACFGLFIFGPTAAFSIGSAAVLLLVWVAAFEVKNPGVRWGMIVTAVIAGLAIVFALFVR